MNATKQFYITTNYLAGARSLQLLTRFSRKQCGNFTDCGYLDSTVVYLLSEPPLSDMTIGNVRDTIEWDRSYHTVNALENSVIPYPIYATGLITVPQHGDYSWLAGFLSYSPDNGYNGYDTATYFVQDVYGRRDTGNIFLKVENVTQIDAQICYS